LLEQSFSGLNQHSYFWL